MYLPYAGLKVIHDQMIQESLERHRPDDGQAPHLSNHLSQVVGKVLARFTIHTGRNQESLLPGSAQGESCTVV